jgi:hypothetical protein
MSSTIEQTAIALAKAALNSSTLGSALDGAQQPQQKQSASEKPSSPGKQHKPRVSTGTAMLIGAGLMAAGQVLVRTRGRDVLNSVRHELAERIDGGGGDEEEALADEDFDDEDYEDEDEPDDEADEDFDDEDYDEEPEDYEDEDEPDDEADDDFDDEDYDEEPEDHEDEDEPDDEDLEEDEEDEDERPARRSRRSKAAR